MQGDFPERALHRLDAVCRDATSDVARARECPPVACRECPRVSGHRRSVVPVSYPWPVVGFQNMQRPRSGAAAPGGKRLYSRLNSPLGAIGERSRVGFHSRDRSRSLAASPHAPPGRAWSRQASKATAVFGDRCIGELTSQQIAAWRMRLSPGYRFYATRRSRLRDFCVVAGRLLAAGFDAR